MLKVYVIMTLFGAGNGRMAINEAAFEEVKRKVRWHELSGL